MSRLMAACAWVAGWSLLADVVHVLLWPADWQWVGWGIPLSVFTLACALLRRRALSAEPVATTAISTWHALVPGSVISIDQGTATAEQVRVTSTAGIGPFTSEVRPIGTWERRWLLVRGSVLRAWRRWTGRVWWPAVFWIEDRWTEWRQR